MQRAFRPIFCYFTVCLAVAFAVPGVLAAAPATVALATIVDGKARLLRGADVFVLREGVAIAAADILETDERTHVQIEFADGTTVGVGPKTMLLLTSLPAGGERAGELVLQSGWVKLSGGAGAALARVVSPAVSLQPKAAAFVLHSAGPVVEVFVESGKLSATLLSRGASSGIPGGPAQAMKAGDFGALKPDRTLEITARPGVSFLAALPRTFVETLPSRLAGMTGKLVNPMLERSVDFAEAERWLKTPTADRKALLRRFGGLLKDRDFRAKVDANLADFPEWERQLHPEKFVTKASLP